jgi:hypothetical protein
MQDAIEARYDAGHEDGYAAALGDMLDFIKAKMTPGGKVTTVVGSFLADHPGDENDAEPAAVMDGVPSYLRKAYERLKTSPGITSRAACEKWGGSNSVLYQLAKRGLAEKRGSQFFPVER